MPWCEACADWRDEAVLAEGGACPSCGQAVAEGRPAPWHFKLLLVATVVYLGWRAYQGVAWLIGRF